MERYEDKVNAAQLERMLMNHSEEVELKYEEAYKAATIQGNKKSHKTKRKLTNEEKTIRFVVTLTAIGLAVRFGILAVEKINTNADKIGLPPISTEESGYEINGEFNMEYLSRRIGGLLMSEEDKEKFNGNDVSIIAQSTFRIDRDTAGYNLTDAARKIYSLDSSIREYAIGASINDMGSNRDNYVEEYKATNADYFIKELALLAPEEEKASWIGVSSLDDYLIKCGFIDEEGNPSLDVMKSKMNNNAEAISIIVSSMAESKGVGKNG